MCIRGSTGEGGSTDEGSHVNATLEVGGDLARFDAAMEALPDRPAVFLLWPAEGEPYLSLEGQYTP